MSNTIDNEIFHSILQSLEKIKRSVPSRFNFNGCSYDIDEFMQELNNRTEVGIKIYEMYVKYRERARNFRYQ